MTTSAPSTSETGPGDARPLTTAAQQWVGQLLENVTPEMLDRPTPCDELDVRRLIGHMLGVERRLLVAGEGGDPSAEPVELDVPGDAAGAYREAAATAMRAWADANTLDLTVNSPWGPTPGAVFMAVYAVEHLTHGWDLAIATGQEPEADPALAEACLAIANQGVPAERDDIPFGAVVEPAADARPTERLANWMGRPSRPPVV